MGSSLVQSKAWVEFDPIKLGHANEWGRINKEAIGLSEDRNRATQSEDIFMVQDEGMKRQRPTHLLEEVHSDIITTTDTTFSPFNQSNEGLTRLGQQAR